MAVSTEESICPNPSCSANQRGSKVILSPSGQCPCCKPIPVDKELQGENPEIVLQPEEVYKLTTVTFSMQGIPFN